MNKTHSAIQRFVVDHPKDMRAVRDLFDSTRALYDAGERGFLVPTRDLLYRNIRRQINVEDCYDILRKAYLLSSQDVFEDYMIALEWNRPAKEKFYLPRQQVLRPVVNDLQLMIDDKLDELFFSMPGRVGKTQLLTMLVTFLIGKNSEMSNLYTAYSDKVTGPFYRGVLEVLTDPDTYRWGDIFPNCRIADTNAKDYTLNIDRYKKYSSLTCRSIGGSLNGSCDCRGFMVADDLVEGAETARSKDRLASLLSLVRENLMPRAKMGAKMVWMGTRWSDIDPIGVRLDSVRNNPSLKYRRWKEINLPALDPKTDESNFNYKFGVGFDTEYYHGIRAMFEEANDTAGWLTQYQGVPTERAGALFEPDEMKYFNGELPEGEPDRIFSAVDPAWGGSDAVAAPIAFQYGPDVFVMDFVYSFEDKRYTQPALAKRFIKWGVQAVQFECNKMTAAYKEGVEKAMGEVKINMTMRSAPNSVSKENRIRDKAPNIRDLYFLEDGKRTKEYSLAMQNLFSFSITSKNKHDDVPDALAQMCDLISGRMKGKAEPMRRPNWI